MVVELGSTEGAKKFLVERGDDVLGERRGLGVRVGIGSLARPKVVNAEVGALGVLVVLVGDELGHVEVSLLARSAGRCCFDERWRGLLYSGQNSSGLAGRSKSDTERTGFSRERGVGGAQADGRDDFDLFGQRQVVDERLDQLMVVVAALAWLGGTGVGRGQFLAAEQDDGALSFWKVGVDFGHFGEMVEELVDGLGFFGGEVLLADSVQDEGKELADGLLGRRGRSRRSRVLKNSFRHYSRRMGDRSEEKDPTVQGMNKKRNDCGNKHLCGTVRLLCLHRKYYINCEISENM